MPLEVKFTTGKKQPATPRQPKAKSVPELTDLSVGFLPQTGIAPERVNDLQAYREWLYANANVIAEGVSAIEFELYKLEKNGDITEVTQHPILEFLYKVNPATTKQEFIYISELYKILLGESFWYLVGAGLNVPPKQMYCLRPDLMTAYPGDLSKGQMYSKFSWKKGKEVIEFKPEEILFMKKPDPENPYRGMGIVKAAALTLDTDTYAATWNRNFFFNSARPDTVLSFDAKNMTQDQINSIKSQINEGYRGPKNVHKTMVLFGGAKIDKFQESMKDMDFLESQKWTRDKIMALVRNTKIALGITEDVNRANAEASEYVHAKNVIKPRMMELVSALNEFLMPLFDKTGTLFLSFKDPVPANTELLNTELAQLTNKVYTVNESRELKGLEPVEGGDYIYLPAGLSPMMDPTTTPPPADPNPQDNSNQDNNPDDSEENADDEQMQNEGKVIKLKATGKNKFKILPHHREFIKALNNRNVKNKQLDQKIEGLANKMENEIKKLILNTKKKKTVLKTKATRKEEQFHAKQIQINLEFEKKFTDLLRKLYSKQKQSVGARILAIKKSVKSKSFEPFEDYDTEVKGTVDLFTPLEEEIVKIQGMRAMDFLGNPTRYLSTSEATNKAIDKIVLKFAKSINSTAEDRIKRAVQAGIDEGKSPKEVARDIYNMFDDMGRDKAEMIARTEVSRATNLGTIDAYKQSGIVEAKMWLTAMDERVCEFCGPMDGQVLGLDKEYFGTNDTMEGADGGSLSFDYGSIETPPLHPNCRCTIVPYVEGVKRVKRIPVVIRKEEVEKLVADPEIKKQIADLKKEIEEI